MDGRKAVLFGVGALLLTVGVIMLYDQGVSGTDKKPILAGVFNRLKKPATTAAAGK
jgi:hypothetical protein